MDLLASAGLSCAMQSDTQAASGSVIRDNDVKASEIVNRGNKPVESMLVNRDNNTHA